MRVVVQRVSQARVEVGGEVVGKIGQGLLLLVGIGADDTEADLDYVADKTINLRIFNDNADKMNLSILDVDGEILAVSQFTLYGDVSRGRRPSFERARKPDEASALFDYFVARLKEHVRNVQTGRFGARMNVELINEGPVTMVLEHPDPERP